MKIFHWILAVLLFSHFTVRAGDQVYERVYVHTDKDCYVAGEDILLKFYVMDNNFQPSDLSKVGYVEINDTKRPQMQLKIALEKGGGAGKISIPQNISSGIYQLSGYTRYMRNEGENVFFQKQIAVVNSAQKNPDPERFEFVKKNELKYPEEKEPTGLLVRTSQKKYNNRQKVYLSIDNIPANTADLVISVSRNDSIAFVPEINKHEWLKQVREISYFSQQWLPEYGGHIVTGRFVPEPQEELLASLAFVGNAIRYFTGQLNSSDGTVDFYTSGLFGKQQIVTSVVSPAYYDKVPYRLDPLSPFCASLPDNLPVLSVYFNENQIFERYKGAQIQKETDYDLINNHARSFDYYNFQPNISYDLDEYIRFSTISETILEFVNKVRVGKIRDKQVISVFMDEKQLYSSRTLVLLDGIPIYNHEDILNYNPMYIKRVNIYNESYVFGGVSFEGIISFITKEGNMPLFQLGSESQLHNYDFPQLPPSFDSPDYSNEQVRNSKRQDFRHTLYWNPFVEFTANRPANLSFYTSDLCGEFKVTVEAITTAGEIIQDLSFFQVIASSR